MRDFEEKGGKSGQTASKEAGQKHPWIIPAPKKKKLKIPLTSTDKASNGEKTSTVTDGEDG